MPKAFVVDGFFGLHEPDGEIDDRVLDHTLRQLGILPSSPPAAILRRSIDSFTELKRRRFAHRSGTPGPIASELEYAEAQRDLRTRELSHFERLGQLYGNLLEDLAAQGLRGSDFDRRVDEYIRPQMGVFGLDDEELDAYDRAFMKGLARETTVSTIGHRSSGIEQ